MLVLISWSGRRSRALAGYLKTWLPGIVQNIEPFISEDIGKGRRWGREVADKVAEAQFGIGCVTPDNQQAPWIMFEAGAVSKAADSRLSMLLLGLSKSDVADGPLAAFQHTVSDRDGVPPVSWTVYGLRFKQRSISVRSRWVRHNPGRSGGAWAAIVVLAVVGSYAVISRIVGSPEPAPQFRPAAR